ncbi:transposase [Gracilimonas sp.]|uniref:transposase n=1 Tax=Gracilimonas sp. TaxID=1974203 RepID=UPI003BA997F0
MIKLEPNRYYHIYNRGNNLEKLFYSKANYEYFLSKFQQHCFHVFVTYAFCLMGNHFHLLVSVRPVDEQHNLFEKRNLRTKKLRTPSKHLAHFFSSYTQSINKQEGRVGSLFQKNFKRKEIDSEGYFRHIVVYIHLNPLKHGFSEDIESYPYSSYPVYLNSEETFINRGKTLELFGGIKNFNVAHKSGIALF